MLKNAKDACATEALEIATYTAIERLAPLGRRRRDRRAGRVDPRRRAEDARARPARDPQADRRRRRAPTSRATPSYDVTTTGAADAVREAGEATKQAARKTTAATKRTARQARKVPGRRPGRGPGQGRRASEGDLAIARYDTLTADEIIGKLTELSQIDLAKIDAYERKNQNRTTVLSRITSLRGDEPWAGYDELTAAEVQAVLAEGDDDRAKRGPLLRARAQEPRRRPQGRRARAQQRLTAAQR